MSQQSDKVISWTLAAEGVFSDRAWDPGGKTLYGITQRWFPEWYAKLEKEPDPAKRVALAKQFYEAEFWVKNNCHRFDSIYVAGELFDTCVNVGAPMGATITQRAINLVAAQERGGKIPETGTVDAATIAAANRMCARGFEEHLVVWQNQLQGEHYHALYEKDPARWGNAIAGWAKRLVLNPKLIEAKHPEFN